MDERKKKFVEKANEKFNNKFNYDKFVYVNAKTKSIIICPIHGEFEQNPDKHLNSVYGCPECALIERAKTRKGKETPHPPRDFNYFLEKAKDKFGDKFEYDSSTYKNMTTDKIKIKCPVHGWFEKTPHNFLISSFGCNLCSDDNFTKKRTKPYEEFLKKARILYKDKYFYPKENRSIYKNRKSKIKIECPIHGIFEKSAQKFLSGQGCEECTLQRLIEEGKLIGGYNDTILKRNPKIAQGKGYLYYISINDGEKFKIGITRVGVKARIRGIKSNGKGEINKIKIIYTKEGTLWDMYQLEQKILTDYQEFRISTSYSTEIFNTDLRAFDNFNIIFN